MWSLQVCRDKMMKCLDMFGHVWTHPLEDKWCNEAVKALWPLVGRLLIAYDPSSHPL